MDLDGASVMESVAVIEVGLLCSWGSLAMASLLSVANLSWRSDGAISIELSESGSLSSSSSSGLG